MGLKSDKTSHSWNAGVITTPSSCTTEGVKTFTCTVCEKTKTEAVPTVEHTYSTEWTSDENEHWHASTCGCVGLKSDKVTHTWNSGVVTLPTCTSNGYTTYKCTTCQKKFVTDYVIASEHNYIDNECSVCGHLQESAALSFTLSEDGTYYIVSGIGTCSDVHIVVPETYDNLPVKEIGKDAFIRCTSFSKLTIPQSVEIIGDHAFFECTNLESVTLNEGVQRIGYCAFQNCSNLKDISVPSSIQHIDTYAFYYCSSLSLVEHDNAYYFGNEDNPYLILYKAKDAYITACDVHPETRHIYHSAFAHCDNLTNVIISDKVKTIQSDAFAYCDDLRTITIPASVIFIGDTAFCHSDFRSINVNEANEFYCTIDGNLYSKDKTVLHQYATGKYESSFVVPEHVKVIAPWAFTMCYGLDRVSLPSGLETIDDYAFYYSNMETIEIPSSVKNIGYYAFEGCDELKAVYISDLQSWCNLSFESYSSNPLYFAKNLYVNEELITNLIIPNGVSSIGDYAFCGANIQKVTISDSVTSIGENAFEYSSVKEVIFGKNVESIGFYAFYSCLGLTDVRLSEKITSIDGGAFNGCSNLNAILIFNNLETVGNYAFSNCSKLEKVYYFGTEEEWSTITINYWGNEYLKNATRYLYSESEPSLNEESTSYLGNWWYYDNSEINIWDSDELALQSLSYTLSSDKTYYMVSGIGSCTGATIIVPSVYNSLPVKKIADSAFYNNTQIKYVVVNSGVEIIGEYAFYGCENLVSISLPDTIISIEYEAFYRCSSLVNFAIPQGVTKIVAYTFYGCSSLTHISIPNSVTAIELCAFCGCESLDNVVIPSGVENIGYVFMRCSSLKNVTIPEGVKYMYKAFEQCVSLEEVVVPSTVENMDDAFYGCSNLKKVTLTAGIKSIGENAFTGCSNLTTITIPTSVTAIGDYAFFRCSKLTEISIPNNVESIGAYAFRYCTELTNVTFGNNLKTIDKYAFSDCTNIQSIAFVSKLTAIGDYAFYNCSMVESIVFSDSLESIGEYAFYGCKKITSIVLPATLKRIGRYAFYQCTGLTSAEFMNSNGWMLSASSTATSGTTIDIYNAGDAATLLKNKYCIYYWFK